VIATQQLGRPPASPSQSYERIAACYDATRGAESRGRQIAGDVHPYLGQPGPLLEIGVGTGVVASALREVGWIPVGVDLSPAMLRHAQTRLGPVVAAGDATRLPIAAASVPVALAVWVLHLIADVPAALTEARRVLQPGGRLVIVTHNPPENDPITRLVAALQEALGQLNQRQEQAARLVRLAWGAGLRVTDLARCRPHAIRVAPTEMADAIAARQFSWLWDVPPARWAAVVDPVIASLRALGTAVPVVPRRTIDDIVVLERPSSDGATAATRG
jgi:ubiquinone/menaquinone biosynthesis C-methylase UbiE